MERTRTELTLEDYLGILRRRWVWLVGPMALFGALAALYAAAAPPKYEAVALVLIADSAAQEALDPTNSNFQMQSRRIENEINFALSDDTERVVEEELGFLPDDVEIRGVESADVLEFIANADTADNAARYANVWASAYVASKQEEAEQSITAAVGQLNRRLESLQQERTTLRASLDEKRDEMLGTTDETRRAILAGQVERMAEDLAPSLELIDVQIQQVVTSIGDLQLSGEVARSGTAQILQVAAAPEAESGAPMVGLVLLGLVGGAVVGVALALARESLDKTINDADEVTEAVGLPVLGTIPEPGKSLSDGELVMATRDHPGSGVADGYHRVSTAFQFAAMGRDVRSLLVTSANQSEGKTTTSANLAWSLASLGSRVALVDVDFRRPRLHTALGARLEPGLSNHLLDGTSLSKVATYIDGGRLALITAGTAPPNPAEFVATREFATVLGAIAKAVDVVILDAPPLLPVADSQSLARWADAVVLTARAGSTSKSELRRAVESVRQVGASVLGVVLIGAKENAVYGTKYGYVSEEDRDENKRSSRRRRKRRTETLAEPSPQPAIEHVRPEPVQHRSAESEPVRPDLVERGRRTEALRPAPPPVPVTPGSEAPVDRHGVPAWLAPPAPPAPPAPRQSSGISNDPASAVSERVAPQPEIPDALRSRAPWEPPPTAGESPSGFNTPRGPQDGASGPAFEQ